ncbi:hotdog domain-containing protein [Peristeroidobacter soli]|jgi:3-aminobutyryl-CoA ammonia-lyase|uniref:hotdog domain-containing protein n=1 Tax=Peristeroidobacter soli TaxID=2497877 RepID=UPI00101D6E0B|nr:hotdog domain-containing protein [Peristeroidobacter soli]
MSGSLEGVIRVRMSTADGHYAGGLVDGARVVQLFGDAVTELLIRHDGDEGLSRVMNAEFLAPVRSGDFLEIRAKIVAVGKSSRTIECTAHKLIELVDPNDSAANVLAEPLLVARMTDVAVVPLDKQRNVK